MKTGGKPIAFILLGLAAVVLGVWLSIALPPWIREQRAIARLKSPDPKARNQAAEALAEIGSVKAIPAILEIMGNPQDGFNYLESLQLIIEKSGYKAIPALVENLKRPDRSTTRNTVFELLGDLGTEARVAIPQLTELLDHPDPSVRLQAAKALFEVGAEKESYIPVLDKLRKDQNAELRMEVLWAVWAMALDDKQQWTIPALIEALNDTDSQIVGTCLWTLGLLGAEASAAIPSVVEKTKDSSTDVRLAALQTLGAIGSGREEVLPLLVAALNDPEAKIRVTVATGLSKMGPRAAPALPALKGLLGSDPDESVRRCAACGVLKLEPENPPAAKIINSARDSIVKGADRWLRTDQKADFDTGDPSQAALLSMGIEDRELRVFIDALNDPDPMCRTRALSILGYLGPAARPALHAIIEATRDRSLRVQATCVLAEMGPSAAEAIPALNEALKSRNAFFRFNARRALALIQKDQRAP